MLLLTHQAKYSASFLSIREVSVSCLVSKRVWPKLELHELARGTPTAFNMPVGVGPVIAVERVPLPTSIRVINPAIHTARVETHRIWNAQDIELLEPKGNEEGGTYVIPGHGHICDPHDVVDYRDMMAVIRGRIQYFIKQGMTLDEVKAAKPTFDYDGLYGAATGPWTTDMFVEAVYRDLSNSKTPQEQEVGAGR